MNSSPRRRRISWPAVLAFVCVALVLLGLTLVSVLRGVTQEEESAEVVHVLTGQSLEISTPSDNSVLRLMMMRAPLPAGESEGETLEAEQASVRATTEDDGESITQRALGLDSCLAEEATQHLASLLPEGTELGIEYPDYPAAPNGETWAMISAANNIDVVLEMVRAGLAAPVIDEAPDDERAQELRDAQNEAYEVGRGIYSSDVDCTLPSIIEPELATLEDNPEPNYSTLQQVTEFIGQVNAMVTRAQQLRTTLANIPSSGDTLSALAWGDFKQDYVDAVETRVSELETLLEDAQDARAQMGQERIREQEASSASPPPGNTSNQRSQNNASDTGNSAQSSANQPAESQSEPQPAPEARPTPNQQSNQNQQNLQNQQNQQNQPQQNTQNNGVSQLGGRNVLGGSG